MAEIDPEDAKAALRVLRALQDLSQIQLAERAGVDARSIRRYESTRPAPGPILVQLAESIGLPERALLTILLPTVRYLRAACRPAPSPAVDDTETQIVEEGAAWAAETAAATARAAFLRAWADHVRATLEQDANAWRPNPEDREAALDLWSRLEPLSPEKREVFIDFGDAFHKWALAERVADLAAETVDTDRAKARELAEVAVKIANLVPGSEAWQARVKGYALASLGRVLRETGDLKEAEETMAEAQRLWVAGSGDVGLLREERFVGKMGKGE